MADQPLLINGPRKLPNSAKWRKLPSRRSRSFKVTDSGLDHMRR